VDDDDSSPQDDDDTTPEIPPCLNSLLSEGQPDQSDDGGDHNCRFWSIVTDRVPAEVVEGHLVTLPASLKNLGQQNDNGWGIAWYPEAGGGAEVRRGAPPAAEDPDFDAAAAEVGEARPAIAVSHVRNCSSGLCDIPDPHPFERLVDGDHWLMGHNGGISKQLLRDLVGDEYLEQNPPTVGESFDEWIDSELYFLLLLKTIEEHAGAVEPAIEEALQAMHAAGPGLNGLNFFLTDGETLWAYREDNTLDFFYDDVGAPCSAVASQHPTDAAGWWEPVEEFDLVVLRRDGPPEFIPIDVE